MAAQWPQINTVFLRALDVAPDERSGFLDRACAGDEALRREVESLLASHDEASQFLEQPLIQAAAILEHEDSSVPPTRPGVGSVDTK